MQKQRNRIVMSLAFGAAAFLGFSANEASAHHDDNELIKTVYHVYVDGKEIGTVHHKSAVTQEIDIMLENAEKSDSKLEYKIKEDITYKAERVFRPVFDEQQVRSQLKQELNVAVKAYRLNAGDETVAYVASEKEAQDVIQKLKTQYVTKEELALMEEAKKKTAGNEPKLEPGESIMTDVTFTNDLTISVQEVQPDEIASADSAFNTLRAGKMQVSDYELQSGDTIERIASKHKMSVQQILSLNPKLLLSGSMSEGNTIKVMKHVPFTKVIVHELKREKKNIPFAVKEEKDASMEIGTTKIVQKGQAGAEDLTYTSLMIDGKMQSADMLTKDVVKQPVEQIVKIGTKEIPSKGTGSMVWPAVGGYVSSHKGERWGRAHKGIDIARPTERSILAADNGTVVEAGFDNGGYGNKIVINHNNGMRTMYAHLSSIAVKSGDVVKKGQKIGVMGSTGQSTGIHLHFEVYKNNALQNPLNYVSE
ncbi:peptidoglycan DD-metalloendopeptidase family protein [Fictibacillus iocasae]|uniref:Peptidoglycan DD-metalloendopeptidase family protein n=1 Tax=Fictibacillus iocasae TaxID=2715437 RepID=A0ABW2NJF1_9BACL